MASSPCTEPVLCSLCDRQDRCTLDPDDHGRWLVRRRLAAVGRRVLVLSNKGGVGKSTVAANLAAALAAAGLRVGLADADLTGPSIPHLFGLSRARVRLGPDGLVPLVPDPAGRLRVASIGFLLETPDAPALWRDSFKFEFLQQLVAGFAWGPLEVLLVDMPPGTGGELIGLVDLLDRVDGAVLVTTPQDLALADVVRGAAALRDCGVPVLGVIENMAGVTCPHCGGAFHPFKAGGGQELAHRLGVPLLASVPLDPDALAWADAGRPVVWAAPASPAAVALRHAAEALAQRLGIPL